MLKARIAGALGRGPGGVWASEGLGLFRGLGFRGLGFRMVSGFRGLGLRVLVYLGIQQPIVSGLMG